MPAKAGSHAYEGTSAPRVRTRAECLALSRHYYSNALRSIRTNDSDCRFWLARANLWGEKATHW
jgi:hypothetical protein